MPCTALICIPAGCVE